MRAVSHTPGPWQINSAPSGYLVGVPKSPISMETVVAGSARVTAYGSARVTAYGSASVTASDSARVISTTYHSNSAQVALADLAAHIDRRSGKLELRKATAA